MSRWKRFNEITWRRSNAPISQYHPIFGALLGALTIAVMWAIDEGEKDLLFMMMLAAGLGALLQWVVGFYLKAWKDSSDKD